MLITKPSNDLYCRIAGVILTIILWGCLLVAPPTAAAQGTLNLAEPLRKCRTYGTNNGMTKVIASDNENAVLSVDNSLLISINSDTQVENWRTQLSGRLAAEAVTNENTLYLLTSVGNEFAGKNYQAYSISLKTGLTNWQKKLFEIPGAEIKGLIQNEQTIIFGDSTRLSALDKIEGNLQWTKEFSENIRDLRRSQNGEIEVLVKDKLIIIDPKNGENRTEMPLNDKLPSSFLSHSDALYLGYPNGEFRKLANVGKNRQTVWKIKTGASVTGLYNYKSEILLTSLDNFLYLFSDDGGKIKWKRRIGGRINIKPLIIGNHAVIASSGDNSAIVVNLDDGKIINLIQLENDNYVLGIPYIFQKFIFLQTYKGIYSLTNTNNDCK